jgi:hypothetical protein
MIFPAIGKLSHSHPVKHRPWQGKTRWSDFKDDRLQYVMDKNNKPVSLKILKKAKAILEFYKFVNSVYITCL